MIVYLLKSIGCLALLLFFYHFILEKEKMHNFNRYYLLGSVIFSFLVPLTTITTVIKNTEPLIVSEVLNKPTNSNNFTPIIIEETFNYTQLYIGIYLLIAMVFLIRFGFNLFKIINKIKRNKRIKYKDAVLVLVEDKILPHTFLKYIFINKEEYIEGNIEEELFTHELTHVIQKHTIDVLIIEFIQAICWINPLFIFTKKAIQLNHEFLADQTVINQHKNTFHYQYLLLNKAAWNNEYYLASNLNYSLTKKRLEMMTTQSSQTKILLKKLAVIPLLAGFVFFFAERVEAQEKKEIIEIVEEIPNQKIKISETEIYKDYANRNTFITYKDKNGKKISKKYSELTKEEKKKVIPPPPLKFKKNPPSKKQFEDLKDVTKVAVWLNGKVVKNEVLNKYKHTDFARYSNSFVYKNARSKRFPQKYQASLETKKYFETQNNKRVQNFKKYLEKKYKIEEIKEENPTKREYIDSPISRNNSSKQSISKETPFLTTTIKMGKKIDLGTITDIRHKLKDVNALKISYNKDSVKFNMGWFITIDNQRYYYTFNKNERISRYYKNGKLVNIDIVKEYKKKHKIYLNLRSKGKHYVFKTKKEQKLIEREFSDLGGMYFRMSRNDKNKVKRPIHPHKPYLKLSKNNKVFYKLRKDLTEEDKLLIPPPPPAPNASKEEILKAKKAYKDWKKRTGNDGAPPPPKKTSSKEINNQKSISEILKSRKKSSEKVTYYLDGKIISKKELKTIKSNLIKSIRVEKDKDNKGSGSIYIISKK